MNRPETLVCELGAVRDDVEKAVELLVGQLDSKQYPLAAYELGRIEELGSRLAAAARAGRGVVWDLSQKESL